MRCSCAVHRLLNLHGPATVLSVSQVSNNEAWLPCGEGPGVLVPAARRGLGGSRQVGQGGRFEVYLPRINVCAKASPTSGIAGGRLPYVSCPCGVRVWVNRTEGGFRTTWTADAVNGCAEMRKLRALEPGKQHPINCDRLMRLIPHALQKNSGDRRPSNAAKKSPRRGHGLFPE
jgi:hypothetical protein